DFPAKVVATYEPDAVLQADVTLSLAGFDALGVPPTDRTTYVVARTGADRAALRAGLDAAVRDLPTVTVADQAQYAAEQRQPIDRLLFIVYALLGLAVVIAVLGIVNTLALSVVERVREIGLLRAVGLGRRQLRMMLRLESVAIAVLGAVLGVVLGLAFALALQRSLADEGIDVLAVPWLQLVGFVAVAALVGVLAALWPGRRAARVDVLRAIATE
ncbi:FtsX-like permease family protein, partial [Phycicoccus sp.]|uniref:FtsX-like permease family protein n=1 Tax=Phycicoccus sp. TaxID=1902410 RepID=UPI002CD21D56